MALSRAQAGTVLKNLGFRVNTSARLTQAIKDFQRGWNLGAALKADGVVGPKTSAALSLSEARRRKHLGTMSAHFSFSEFVCKCGGKYASCRRVWMVRGHIQRLETYRAKVGAVRVISGCRCPSYNKSIGGASSSQHMFGTATDLQGPDKDKVAGWRIFAGIGYGGHSDTVKHVDSRDLSGGHNLTGGRPAAATKWVYPGW